MKSALLISLVFHFAVGIVWMTLVRFTQVRFVPRDVYFVDLVTPAPPAPVKKVAPEPVVKAPPQPAPEEDEPDDLVPPPEEKKPKPKPPPKEKKTVPSTKVTPPEEANADSALADADSTPVQTGDMVIDGEEFPFGYYLTTLKRKIAGLWRVPDAYAGEPLYCTVYFRVGRDGAIVSPVVEMSSGNFLFDQSALRAVVQSNPLPPLPGGFTEEFLGVHFSFAYEQE